MISLSEAVPLANKALQIDDVAGFRQLLDQFPELRAGINKPVSHFDSPLILWVRSEAMLDALLDAGADIDARSKWWAGGFGVLDQAEPAVAAGAIKRGATVTVHAAARLGMIDRLKELIASDPALVNARGGDGQTPLHFASTIEVAAYLLDHGADIDVRDVDHESTPAQYMVRDRQDIARHLVHRGCKPDILMATALGNADLVRKHLDTDPECVRVRVNDDHFPMINPKAGGTIYQWTLGWHVSAHDVARQFGHQDILQLLMERSPLEVKLLAACWGEDQAAVNSLLSRHPGLAHSLSESDRRQVAHAARNNNLGAVRMMLGAGLPGHAPPHHRATPLGWAAFPGNNETARET